MPLDIPMTVSGIIGFAPAVLLLAVFLKRYDTLFDDRKLFITFGVGMILGMIITTFHALSDGIMLARVDAASILLFLGVFVFFEQLVKSAALNSKWLKGRFDTTYYGAALGLGIGSMAIIIRAYTALRFGNLSDPALYLILIGISFVTTMIHAVTGAIIGYGSYKGESWKYLAIAMGVFVPYQIMSIMYSVSTDYLYYASAVFIAAMLVYAGYLSNWTYHNLLPRTLPEKMRKDMLKKKKAIMRKSKRLAELAD